MKNFSKNGLVFAPALALALSVGASNAAADTIVGTAVFTSDHCTGGCLTGQTNGGTITVTDHGTGTLDFLIQLANGNQFVNTGFEASFGFNLDSTITQITYSNITPSAGFTIPDEVTPPSGSKKQNPGTLHMDGTGFFKFGLEAVGSGGSTPQGSTLSFTIAATGLDIFDFRPNAEGQYFAADIISGTTGKTGGIDESFVPTPTLFNSPVPDGGSAVMLLGSALLGLGMLRRRFGRS